MPALVATMKNNHQANPNRKAENLLEQVDCLTTVLADAEALDVLAKNASFKLVLTDMRMPVLDGEGLIREIRDKEQWKGLPVYAATAPGAVFRSFFKTRRQDRAGGLVRTATSV